MGCGRVTWQPAPYTPLGVELAYSPVEDITRLRFRVADAASLSFELADARGAYHSVRFTAAPYPSGSYPCDEDTCFQLVVAGAVTPPPGQALLRSIHPSFGTFSSVEAKALPPVTDPVQLAVATGDGNVGVQVTLGDWLTAPGLRRTMRYGLWSEPADPCALHPERADEAGGQLLAPGSQTILLPSVLTDDGRYCVGARPERRDGGPTPRFATELLLFPETERHEARYAPPSETAPVVWRLVSDLEIIDPSRCATIQQQVRAALAASLSAAATFYSVPAEELDRVDLSPTCHHDDTRALDAGPLADEVKRRLAARYPQLHQAPLLVYLDNLDAPLPAALGSSLAAYVSAFGEGPVVPLTLAIGSGLGLSSFPWVLQAQYAALEDPQFLPAVRALVRNNFPRRTQLHDDLAVLPLQPTAELKATAGWRWKICQASPPITPMTGADPVPADADAPTVDPAQRPGYRVTLPPRVLVPASQFVGDTVVVRYELCRRYCDHPFTDEPGTRHPRWTRAAECVRNEAP